MSSVDNDKWNVLPCLASKGAANDALQCSSGTDEHGTDNSQRSGQRSHTVPADLVQAAAKLTAGQFSGFERPFSLEKAATGTKTNPEGPFLDVRFFPVPPGFPSWPDPSPAPGFGRNRKFCNKLHTLDSLLKVGGKALKVRRYNL